MTFSPIEEERLCDCGSCKYCDAKDSSDYDYEGDNYLCPRCEGAGCMKCEE